MKLLQRFSYRPFFQVHQHRITQNNIERIRLKRQIPDISNKKISAGHPLFCFFDHLFSKINANDRKAAAMKKPNISSKRTTSI